MKEIASISLGPASRDYELTTQIWGEEFHVRRMGTDGDAGRARELVAQFDGQVDAIGLGGICLQLRVGQRTYGHRQAQQIASAAHITPVVDGAHLKETLERWAISRVAEQRPGIFDQKCVLVLSGIDRYGVAEALSLYTPHLSFGDPIFQLNIPFTLRSFRQLERYASLVLPVLCRGRCGAPSPASADRDVRTPRGSRYFQKAEIIAGSYDYIRRFAPDNLRHKVIITSDLAAADLEELRAQGVESVITVTPPPGKGCAAFGADVMEAILSTFVDRPPAEITHDDYLTLVARCELEPQITILNEPRPVDRFAFVIHPLSIDDIFFHPLPRRLRFLPKRLIEWVAAFVWPLYLSRITGVRSPATSKEVEGILITLGATPRELMRRKPSFTYRRLMLASRIARQKGAKIMGLGAFTKVVGDAGISLANRSEIAITTGNSLTAMAALETAKQAVRKMGGRVDRGRAVIIGATGSIGAVCSRLLAQACHDVVLVAPRPEKLILLKRTIEAETPQASVTIATDSGAHLSGADLVVTTTTAMGQKVLDVLKLKPGCVVCDVARPPDVKEKDARLRPDVLVVESGAVLLPGKPDFGFDIGLPPGVAYACLAETALLAMEGRFENFTLGRAIEVDRVKEIYRLFKKHGLQLEGLHSFGRPISDEEIARKRELVEELRQHPEKLEALIAQAGAVDQAGAAPRQGVRRAKQ
ncbi:MAG: serine carboxypeptidase [Anaerolineae bacterium]|nr:serine carboxypeptidase [Anaerolineae bacterium]